MSTVGTLTKLASEVVGKAAHAVVHPRQTVAAVTGHARDLASTVTGGGSQPAAPEKAAAKARETSGPVEPTVVPSPPKNTKPAKPAKPARPVEPSTTEPKAASRAAAHQGRGAEPTDDWREELDDAEDLDEAINPATGQPHNTPSDEPLLDPAVAKAVRSESETMRKAADPAGE